MIDSLLDYPCVTAQPRASLMREASLTPPVTPFQITDDKPSIYQRMCDSHCWRCVIGSVSQSRVYQSSCLSSVFQSWRNCKIGSVPSAWTMKMFPTDKKTTKNISHLVTNEKTDQFFPGVKKNTQTNKYNNCCFEITCPYPKRAVCASSNVFIQFCWSCMQFYTKWQRFFQKRKILKP